MKATILCPGPSLAQLESLPECDISIAVNRAVYKFPVQWWCCSDYPVLRDYKVDYELKLFTNEANLFCIKRCVPTATEVLTKESLLPKYPADPSAWTLFTASSALVLAAHLGATEITCYGIDWKGIADWDGHEYAWVGNEAWRTRKPDTFDDQRKVWERTAKMLGDRGVSVERVQLNLSLL